MLLDVTVVDFEVEQHSNTLQDIFGKFTNGKAMTNVPEKYRSKSDEKGIGYYSTILYTSILIHNF